MQNKSINEKPDGFDISNSDDKNAKICQHFKNINTIRMKHTEAKGPNLARGKQITMINGQDFCYK